MSNISSNKDASNSELFRNIGIGVGGAAIAIGAGAMGYHGIKTRGAEKAAAKIVEKEAAEALDRTLIKDANGRVLSDEEVYAQSKKRSDNWDYDLHKPKTDSSEILNATTKKL